MTALTFYQHLVRQSSWLYFYGVDYFSLHGMQVDDRFASLPFTMHLFQQPRPDLLVLPVCLLQILEDPVEI